MFNTRLLFIDYLMSTVRIKLKVYLPSCLCTVIVKYLCTVWGSLSLALVGRTF